MVLSRRSVLLSLGAATAAGFATIIPDFVEKARVHAQEVRAMQQRALDARRALLDAASFEGTRVLFKADGNETTDPKAFDIAVWHGAKNQITLMTASGVLAGIGVTFYPVMDKGTLRLQRLAQEETVAVDGQNYSFPALLETPLEQIFALREFRAAGGGDSSAWPNGDFVYAKAENNRRLFRVTGAVVKGRAFELSFGRQHKLAINLVSGSYVFNTYGESTFYGRIPGIVSGVMPRQATRHAMNPR